jgi:phosphoribosylamine--glycine ligase
LQPAIDAMAARGTPYVGVLYAGLMLTKKGVRVLEFNCRFGDPETQAILPLLKTDLLDVIEACVEGRLGELNVRWKRAACATVVLAAPGYPNDYPKGLPISGVESLNDGVVAFHAGTDVDHGQLITAGGRVLSISATGANLTEAVRRAYAAVGSVHFEGMHFRHDIGEQAVTASKNPQKVAT